MAHDRVVVHAHHGQASAVLDRALAQHVLGGVERLIARQRHDAQVRDLAEDRVERLARVGCARRARDRAHCLRRLLLDAASYRLASLGDRRRRRVALEPPHDRTGRVDHGHLARDLRRVVLHQPGHQEGHQADHDRRQENPDEEPLRGHGRQELAQRDMGRLVHARASERTHPRAARRATPDSSPSCVGDDLDEHVLERRPAQLQACRRHRGRDGLHGARRVRPVAHRDLDHVGDAGHRAHGRQGLDRRERRAGVERLEQDRARIEPGTDPRTVSSSTFAPWWIITTWSQICSACDITCVEKMIVAPRRCCSRIRSRTRRMFTGSRPLNGSSRISEVGLVDHRGDELDLLLHALRQLLAALARDVGQLDRSQPLVDALAQVRYRRRP